MTSAFHSILDQFRENSHSERDKGSRFEHLILRYLKTDPVYSQRFSEVWLWMDWPLRAGLADQGIDLVAQDAITGEYCAIQCKCYADNTILGLSDIATYTSSINKTWGNGASFTCGIIVDTAADWNKKLQKLIKEFNVPIARLGTAELSQSSIDWSACAKSNDGKPLFTPSPFALTLPPLRYLRRKTYLLPICPCLPAPLSKAWAINTPNCNN